MAQPPPKEFKYLRPAAGRQDQDVVCANYSNSDLSVRAVVRDTSRNCFLVFQDWPAFWAWRRAYAGPACFDEVVFGWTPQLLKFDVDAPAHLVDALDPPAAAGAASNADVAALFGFDLDEEDAGVPEVASADAAAALRSAKMDSAMSQILDAVLDELHAAYCGLDVVTATRDDLVVLDASGPAEGSWKYSFHVLVLLHAVANNEEAKGLTDRVLARLPAGLRPLLDAGVNKSVQNFRLPGSSKPGSARVLEVSTAYGTAAVPHEVAVVRAAPGARVLARLLTAAVEGGGFRLLDGSAAAKFAPGPAIEGVDVEVVLAAARNAGVLDAAHELYQVCGGLLLFRRLSASHCRVCARVHAHDNTLMIAVTPADGPPGDPAPPMCHLTQICRRGGRGEVFAVVSLARPPPAPAAPAPTGIPAADLQRPETAKAIDIRIAQIRDGAVDPHAAAASGFEALPAARKHVYSADTMAAYEAVPTLAVRAQMKLGKTRQLREYIDREYPAAAACPPVIRFVTFRQTFSKSMQQGAFADFELYSDHTGDLDPVRFPRLIVQAESLHRLPMPAAPEPPDLLVLDEAESILAQFNSGLHRRFNASFAMFQWLVANSARVVVMDANLGDRTLNVLLGMRPAHPPFFHWNQYSRAATDSYAFTADLGLWLDHLYCRLAAGQRVVIPTNSLAEAEAFEAGIRERFPDKAVRLYSSKTSQADKARHFADVHTHWGCLDVLIYTPTVSAGVSFELKHFDALFGYFVDSSCDVETCRQMLGRVRDIRTGDHVLCLAGRPNSLPDTVDEIRRLVYDKRSNLYRDLDGAGAQLALQYEYAPDGALRFHETPYLRLWLETTRVENLSRNAFVARFVDQVADSGAAVASLGALAGAEGRILVIRAAHRDHKLGNSAAECAALSAAPDLCPEEAALVRERLSAQVDVPAADVLGLQKFNLRDCYMWHDRPVGPEFVRQYRPRGAVRVFKNLVRACSAPTSGEAIARIREFEAGRHLAAVGGGVHDLNVRYVYQAHYLAITLLRMCGFRCFTDPMVVREEVLYHALRACEARLLQSLEAISFEFEVRRPSVRSIVSEFDPPAYIRKVLGVVNPVVRMMYGIEVRRSPAGAGGNDYAIAQTPTGRLFRIIRPGDPPPDVPYIVSQLGPLPDLFLVHFVVCWFYDRALPEIREAEAAEAAEAAGGDDGDDGDGDDGDV